MKDVPELFADLIMALEDILGPAFEGQQADLSPDVQELLLAAIRAGLVRVQRLVFDIGLALP